MVVFFILSLNSSFAPRTVGVRKNDYISKLLFVPMWWASASKNDLATWPFPFLLYSHDLPCLSLFLAKQALTGLGETPSILSCNILHPHNKHP